MILKLYYYLLEDLGFKDPQPFWAASHFHGATGQRGETEMIEILEVLTEIQ